MFEGIKAGDTVRIHFAGSTQTLAMQARYNGRVNGLHSLSTVGVLAGTDFTATDSALSNGRRLAKVEKA